MKKITLACCHHNLLLAEKIRNDLQGTGLDFQILTEAPADRTGHFAAALRRSADPVLLIVTENLLTSTACLQDLLPVLPELDSKKLLVPIVADGRRIGPDGQPGEAVPTSIDRMADALFYLNHWQNVYLDQIQRQQALPEADRKSMDAEMQITQSIAGTVGEIIDALRNTLYYSWAQITGGDYKMLFFQFDLLPQHEAYLAQKVHAAATRPTDQPVVTQPDQPAAPENTPVSPREQQPETVAPPPTASETVITAPTPPEPPVHTEPDPGSIASNDTADEEGSFTEDDIQQTILDAQAWLQNGQVDRGLQLFREALEYYPHHEQLRTEYLLALSQFAREPEAAERQLEILHDNGIGEAKSYDLMGEIALSKGDYLFAKYSWDRVLQINPDFPGVYRKLGLLASDHLPEYQETAVFYLREALEADPGDVEIHYRLAQLLYQLGLPEDARVRLENVLALDPSHAEARALLTQLSGRVEETENEAGVQSESSFAGAESVREAADTLHAEPEPVQEAVAPVQNESEVIPTAEVARPIEPASPKLTVLITGATSGIGRATAELFARNGHRVLLIGRRNSRLDEMEQEIRERYHNEILTRRLDVRDGAAVRDVLENLPDAWQEIDVLVNNAGLAKGLAPIHEGNLDHWETMIDTNIKGLLYVTRCIAPGMVRRRKGHIINIGSSAGKEVYPNGNVYCATKFAVDALSRGMRLDLHAYNVKVSQVSPGHVEETEFALTRFDGDVSRARIYDDFQPLKASDVAETIYFIATRPDHVNIQDIFMFSTQQASSTTINRSGRN